MSAALDTDVRAPASRLLSRWLDRVIDAPAREWLSGRLEALAADPGERGLYLAVSQAARRLGKAELRLEPGDIEDAARCRADWRPARWSADQAGRLLLILHPGLDRGEFPSRLRTLLRVADVGELVTLYRGLPLYPGQGQAGLTEVAAGGVRSNMRTAFEAVAHDNPFPGERFEEGAWNQMVLKALFIDSRLSPIVGLDRRTNPALARMLCDYAHERWSAARRINPELWRCVGPHADASALSDLARVLREGDERDQVAAALALAAAPGESARAALAGAPALERKVRDGVLSWESIA